MGKTVNHLSTILDPRGVTERTYETARGRYYYAPGADVDKGYPGVTTIIGAAWPSAGLEKWRIGNIAARIVANADDMATDLARIAGHPAAFRDLSIGAMKTRLLGWRDDFTAAERGTRIHAGLEKSLTGHTHDSIKKEMKPDEYEVMLRARDALEARNFVPEYVEVPVYNQYPRYAGTADIIGIIDSTTGDRRRAVIDLKTGRRISRTWLPQLAAYARATTLYHDGQIQDTPLIPLALALHVTADTATFWGGSISSGWADFQACHQIFSSAHKPNRLKKYV